MSDSEGETYEKQVKIVLVGDGSSGKVNFRGFRFVFFSVWRFSSLLKSSIAERFSKGAFNRDYNQTLGIDYYLKRINLTRKTTLTPVNRANPRRDYSFCS